MWHNIQYDARMFTSFNIGNSPVEIIMHSI